MRLSLSASLSRWFEEALHDFHYAIRQHRRAPAFAALVIFILALGIGANVTMAGAIDRLLLRAPLHVREPDQVVRLLFVAPSPEGGEHVSARASYPTYLDLRREVASLQTVAAYSSTKVSVGTGPEAVEADASIVTSSFFSVLGVNPFAGRMFSGTDELKSDGASIAVLGYGFWQRQFGGDSSIISRTLRVGDRAYTVVGISPKGFQGAQSQSTDIWLPLRGETLSQYRIPLSLEDRGSAWLSIIGRMQPNATHALIEQQATTVFRHYEASARSGNVPRRIVAASVIPGRGPDRPRGVNVALWLAGVSVFVLLIACANVSNLLIARAVTRRREIAVRMALGASLSTLARQMLVDALLLAAAGGAAALYLAFLGGRIVERLLFNGSVTDDFVDGRLFGIAAAVAVGTAVIISLAPLTQTMSVDLTTSLRSGAAASGGRRSRTRLILLVTQAALCMLLLIVAGLFAQSLRRVEALDLGVDLDRTLMAKVDLNSGALPQAEVRATYASMLQQVREIDGVSHAAFAEHDPYRYGRAVAAHTPARTAESLWHEGVREVPMEVAVDSGFFRAVGITSLRGRDFQSTDRRGGQRVAIINQELANLLWPGNDPLGQCMLVVWEGGDCVTIVGVIRGFWKGSILARERLVVYVPMDQSDTYISAGSMFIATTKDPRVVAQDVRRAIQSIRPDLPAVSVSRMRDIVSPEFRPWQVAATMFTLFGGIALLIAVVGIYAVVSFTAVQRSQELAVRIALGGTPAHILSVVALDGLRAVSIGLLVGTLVALAFRGRLASLLFQTAPNDPAIIAGMGVLLVAVAAVAAVIPTLRVVHGNPAAVLRVD